MKYLALNIHNVHNQDIRQSYVNQIEKTGSRKQSLQNSQGSLVNSPGQSLNTTQDHGSSRRMDKETKHQLAEVLYDSIQ